MYISKLVNEYAKPYSPYMGNLVNHLPMGQIALYQMNNNFEKIKLYSEYFVKKFSIDLADIHYPKVSSIEECLGKRELYESCLDVVKKSIEVEGMDKIIRRTLNQYRYGLSSGLFHTSIRLFYAIEGYKVDKELDQEVARAIAYYVTGYKKAKKFENRIERLEFKDKMKGLINNSYIKKMTQAKTSRGQKMESFYNNLEYLKMGFVIEGKEEDKIRALLGLLLPMNDYYQNIVILHCITGLHALIGLKDYFDNFLEVLDIMTTCIITHLLTIEGLDIHKNYQEPTKKKWAQVLKEGSNSKVVHTIKYTYTCSELDKLYKIPDLKKSVIKKINNE